MVKTVVLEVRNNQHILSLLYEEKLRWTERSHNKKVVMVDELIRDDNL